MQRSPTGARIGLPQRAHFRMRSAPQIGQLLDSYSCSALSWVRPKLPKRVFATSSRRAVSLDSQPRGHTCARKR